MIKKLRVLWREPLFAAAFVLTLGLGIGANTAIFSLVQGILLQPLPYPHADRLLAIQQPATLQGQNDIGFSFVEVDDYRQQSSTLEEVVEFGDWTFNVLDRGDPHRAVAGLVTANFFDVLGMRALDGRLFLPEDEPREAAPVAVVTYEYWQRKLGGDPKIVGQQLNLTAKSAEIVGVLAPGAHYAAGERNQDFYANYASNDHYVSATMQDDRNHRMTTVFARRKANATLEQTRADLERIASNLHAEHPEDYPEDLGLATKVVPWKDELVQQARPVLWATLAGSLLVLLIACANVANLTMVRALGKRRETSVRAALGGAPGRLRFDFFGENLLLALIGAALGVGVAFALLRVLRAYAATLTTRSAEVSLDLRVLLVTLFVAVASAALFALLPGTAPAKRIAESLSAAGSRSAGSVGRSKLQRALVVSQLAVSFLLLFGSIQLGRTLYNLYAVDPGFDLEQVLTVEAPKFSRVAPEVLRNFTREAVQEVEALPGVEAAAMTGSTPLGGSRAMPLTIKVEGQGDPDAARAQPTVFETVTPGYFRALGIAVVRGREFEDADREDAERVAVVNESAARFYFGDEEPIGRRINYDFGGFFGGESEWMTVVGVAADVRVTGVDKPVEHTLYLPEGQSFAPSTMLVRAGEGDDPYRVAGGVLERLRSLDPERPLEHLRTLEETRNESIAPQRLNALLFGSFAGLALLIATVGVGAMLLWSVSARRRELAIRAAVGAEPGRLLRGVLTEGTVLVTLGLALGALLATLSGRLIANLLFDVPEIAPGTLALAALILLFVGVGAALVPASSAMRSDPNQLLRGD